MSYVTAPVNHHSVIILEEYSRETGELNFAWSLDTVTAANDELIRQMHNHGHECFYSMFTHIEF